jgi:hypothetical protein
MPSFWACPRNQKTGVAVDLDSGIRRNDDDDDDDERLYLARYWTSFETAIAASFRFFFAFAALKMSLYF